MVFDLATKGELFDFIVSRQKLSEMETRRLYFQLFSAVKYLVYTLASLFEIMLTII